MREQITELSKKLNKPISTICGKDRDLDSYENCSNSITLIQYRAGAMGLNSQKSNKIIYFSLPLSSELFEQSKIDSLMKLSKNLWAARRKQDLIDHAEEMKAAKINEYKEKLSKLNKIRIEA